jgi:formylmethanofuran dehydrogenase subunit E
VLNYGIVAWNSDEGYGEGMLDLDTAFQHLAQLHDHLCPRQVLGVRMGRYAAQLFDLDLPQTDKRLLALVEMDGCFADGVAVATGCWLGRRTLRLIDEGKIAATFVDTTTDRALRIRPTHASRERALAATPAASSRWHSYLSAYQTLPVQDLFDVQPVTLTIDLAALISRPDARTICMACGEEITNTREIVRAGRLVCRSCAGDSYYRLGCSDAA